MAEPRRDTTGGGYTINLESFSKRLKSLYSHWEDHRPTLYGGADVFSVANPAVSDDLRYLKSSAISLWLFGYEFPETIMVFTAKKIHILCTQKKALLLELVKKSAKKAVGADVITHVKAKGDGGTALMDVIVRSFGGDDVSVVGCLAKEAPKGKLLEDWYVKVKGSGFPVVDVTNGLADLLAAKDEGEILNIKKAAFLSAAVLKSFVVPKLENIIDDEKKVSHSALMYDTEKAVLEPGRVKVKLKAENVDICYPPIFQSGGQYDLRPSALSNDDNLYYESGSVTICAVGARYNSYCSNVARTFLIDATPVQSKAYEVLLKAHQAAIAALKPGNKASMSYSAAMDVVEREAPQFVGNLTKSAGAGIGLEFRESGSTLNAKNELVLRPGMAFNVMLGFHNLQDQTTKPKTNKFSLLLADTVIVSEKGPEITTKDSSKDLKDVAYSFNEGHDEEEELPKVKVKPQSNGNGNEGYLSKTRLRSDNGEMNREEVRKQHQAELSRQKNQETAQRLAGAGCGSAGDSPPSSSRPLTELVAYKNVNDMPPSKGGKMMIQIDQKNEAILLPIHGVISTFHVATIKTVSNQSDTNHNSYVRIQFNIPIAPHQGAIYVKEISFRSKDSRHINEVVAQIKTLRRQVAAKDQSTLVSQEKLLLSGNKIKPIRLSDVWIRPVLGGRGRKLSGSLECHVNGFRYSTSRSEERVDVMFANIKHALFQPSENEMITLLHFHLHNHIMVGNKKTKDVQFFVEVMEVVHKTHGGSKRSAYDPDEIEEEKRERDRKNKINMDFQRFVNQVNDIIEFDEPMRELGFHGVPYKTTAFIVPTCWCLVELLENPFLVITLGEIEIVNLERVGLGQSSFDMAIVFKDFKREVFRIDSIPTTCLESVKEWMDTSDIKYYEGSVNLSWKNILKTIIGAPQEFIQGGGWEFLNVDGSDDSDSDGSEESDMGYEPSDMEEAESESEEEAEAEAEESESMEEEEEDSEQESEEEKGKTWEELEREASNADRNRGDESDSEEERRPGKKKMKGVRPGPSSSGRASRGGPTKRPKLR